MENLKVLNLFSINIFSKKINKKTVSLKNFILFPIILKKPLNLQYLKNNDIPFSLKEIYLIDGIGIDGYIEGIVKEKGIPVSRRVFCYHRKSGKLVGSTVSNKEGYYKFDKLLAGIIYYVASLDEFSDGIQYPAVIQDLIPAKRKE